jgi:hypothetical protein
LDYQSGRSAASKFADRAKSRISEGTIFRGFGGAGGRFSAASSKALRSIQLQCTVEAYHLLILYLF